MLAWIETHWDIVVSALAIFGTIGGGWYRLNLSSKLIEEKVETITSKFVECRAHCDRWINNMQEHHEDRNIHVASDDIEALKQLIIDNRSIVSNELMMIRNQLFTIAMNRSSPAPAARGEERSSPISADKERGQA